MDTWRCAVEFSMTKTMTMTTTRWRAASVHLGLCTILYIALLYPIFFHWYPQPYFATDGGWQGLTLITGVDLVLGPLLTLIVFKIGKPGLRRDLTLIGILQTVAIIWGTWIVFEQRIAMVTYADGTYYTLTHEQLNNVGGKAVQVAEQGKTIPPYGYIRIPTDPSERRKFLINTVLHAGTPLLYLSDLYEPLGPSNLQEVLAGSLNIEQFITKNEENRRKVERFLTRHGGKLEDYAFMPLFSRYHLFQPPLVAVRRTDGLPFDTLEIDQKPPTVDSPTDQAAPIK